MEQKQNELPEGSLDPVHAEQVCLEGCPFLGMKSDPKTSLAFPHSSNFCYRVGTPAGIELAHQSGYCLSGQYESCYVYGQPDALPSDKQPVKTKFSLAVPAITVPSLDSLPSLEPHLESLQPRLDSLKLRLLSLRLSLLLFKLRLLAKMPDRSQLKQRAPLQVLGAASIGAASIKEGLLPAQQKLSELKQNLPPLDQRFSALKSRVPTSKINLALSNINTHSLKQLDPRLLALPLMLLLILAAAIIWWPPPGGSEQDAVVMGASITKESEGVASQIAAAGGQDRLQPESGAVLLDKALLPALKSVDSGTYDQSSQAIAGSDVPTAGDQALHDASAEAEDSIGVAEEEWIEAQPQPAGPAAADQDTAGGAEQNDAGAAQSSEQETEPQPIAPEQLEQLEAETAQTQPVELDAQASSALPVAAIASIGPSAETLPLQEIYDSLPSLYLFLEPGEETSIVARVSEQQPATILGRDSSGEWLLVRLAGGIEGWANAADSGADIIVSNLPAVDNVVVAAPQDPAENTASEADDLPIVNTAVVNTGALNLRSGPGVEYETIGVVYNKQQVSLLEQPGSDGWVQVRLSDGLQGWLNSNYMILTS